MITWELVNENIRKDYYHVITGIRCIASDNYEQPIIPNSATISNGLMCITFDGLGAMITQGTIDRYVLEIQVRYNYELNLNDSSELWYTIARANDVIIMDDVQLASEGLTPDISYEGKTIVYLDLAWNGFMDLDLGSMYKTSKHYEDMDTPQHNTIGVSKRNIGNYVGNEGNINYMI